MDGMKPGKLAYFDGRRDAMMVTAWLYQAELKLGVGATASITQEMFVTPQTTRSRAFGVRETPVAPERPPALNELQIIRTAVTYFREYAVIWWLTEDRSGVTSWKAFSQLIVDEFVPADANERARDQIHYLKQNTSVFVYASKFRSLSLLISDMGPAEKYDKFVRGLKQPLQLEVRKAKPATFDELVRLAITIDEAGHPRPPTQQYSGWGTARVPNLTSGGSVPMDLGQLYTTKSDVKRKGTLRCYNCGKNGHFSRNCTARVSDERKTGSGKGMSPQSSST